MARSKNLIISLIYNFWIFFESAISVDAKKLNKICGAGSIPTFFVFIISNFSKFTNAFRLFLDFKPLQSF
jgi:hypothetical protein